MADDELMRSAQEAIHLLTDSINKLHDLVNGKLGTKDKSLTASQLLQQIDDSLTRGEYVVDRLRAAHPEEMTNRSGDFFYKAFEIYGLCDELCEFLFWDEIAEDTEKEM